MGRVEPSLRCGPVLADWRRACWTCGGQGGRYRAAVAWQGPWEHLGLRFVGWRECGQGWAQLGPQLRQLAVALIQDTTQFAEAQAHGFLQLAQGLRDCGVLAGRL